MHIPFQARALTMASDIGFRLPHLCLPGAGIDLHKWAVVACDQYTAEPEYWREVAATVGDDPSTLHLIFPEVYLEAADAPQRIQDIQQTMRRYLQQGLLREHAGSVLVERRTGEHTRRGLMLELDLEHYDFSATSTSLIRPTEGTIVARLAPRIAVRREAELELPHVLVLIDDPQCTVIEPLARAIDRSKPLYDMELMQRGGHLAGHAVPAALAEQAMAALRALADPQAFAQRYGVPAGTPPMLFAMGDGNHSLATAKAIWEQIKGSVGMGHPSRYALVEVENIHDPALAFEPIHRLLFGVTADVRQALQRVFGAAVRCEDVASGEVMRQRVSAGRNGVHSVGLIGPGARFSVVEIDLAAASLAVAAVQSFVDTLIEQGGAAQVDYVHGDDVLQRLAVGQGCIGFHVPTVSKSELLRRVVHQGPLPRKTFSMGEAHEKRFYVEARRIRPAAP